MKFRLLLLALAATAWAQTLHLQVLSATVNPESHHITVEVQNQSSKVVTGYDLQIKLFDAAVKPIEQPGNVGVDLLAYNRTPQQWEEIQPGAISTFPVGVVASPDTVSAKATVTGVVYADRTFEGAGTEHFFVGRANDAKECRRAIALLRSYPATPEAVRAVLQNLRSQPHGIALGAVANSLHLAPAVAGTLADRRQAVPEIGVPAKEQWDEVIADLAKRAAFLEAESQEASQ
ncbi:MAG TPA: hypothetical protein VHU83_12525 [Bryobacteraceae bacterium]|jgi:hypothetical protein|nr:hypothetical protein [Bryobacteraceae bacterium]